ncbi:MAG: hypothetical protein U0411_01805 [Thermodesulfovibrionales bacterium]
MKRIVTALVIVLVFSVSAQAQMGSEQKEERCQQGMMAEEGNIPMMQMCMPMMHRMMGQGMMMKDMMGMMMDMMKMQKKMMKGVSPSERKTMMMDMDKMMDSMEKMMSDMRGMMMKGMMGSAPAEPGKEERQEAPAKEEAPKGDLHKH